MTWRDTWVTLVGLAGIAAAVVVVWLIGASVTRRMFNETGTTFERWEWPFVYMVGFVSVVVAGGLLAAAYALGCAVVGCAA